MSSQPGVTASRFKFNGKEDETALGWIDFNWRHYDPAIARFFNVDRLAEKFPYLTPYQFASNDPVGKIELDGLEGVPAWVRTTAFTLRHSLVAGTIGSVGPGANNISTDVVRFSTRGASSSDRGSVLEEPRGQHNEGSQVNGFRHTLWQAAITSEFGADIASQVGNAHEENLTAIDGMSNEQLMNNSFQTLAAADESADLANNRAGRNIGGANEGLGLRDMAQQVLNVAKDQGVWTAIRQTDGTWKISPTKITTGQYEALKEMFSMLNNHGRTPVEQENHENRERVDASKPIK